MSRDILGEYGPESEPGGNRSSCGGVTMKDKVDVMRYQTPQGPKYIMNTGVGLRGGDNHGTGQRPMGPSEGGSVGLHGRNKGNSGSQGRR